MHTNSRIAQNEIAIKAAEQEKQSKSRIAAAQADTAVAQAKARAEQKAREKQEELNLRVAVAKADPRRRSCSIFGAATQQDYSWRRKNTYGQPSRPTL